MTNVQLIMENWRQYLNEEQQIDLLVEEIWAGSYVTKLMLIEDQQRLLDEGIGSFFSSAFSAVKGKIEDFNEWKEQKLMSFIDSALNKIQSFFLKLREIAKETANKVLLKLFPKNMVRNITSKFGVFRRPQYLKAGASVLAALLSKLGELGAEAILNAMSGGGATAAKIAKHIEKLKLILESVKAALDPNGLVKMLENLVMFKDAAELLAQLKKDLQNPFRDLQAQIAGGGP